MNKVSAGVALVTGASSGIGYATAAALLQAGYRVYGTSRKTPAAGPAGVAMRTADVRDDASVARLIGDVLAEAGRIDLLVNNAGIGVTGGAEESSVAQAQALFDVNVFGTMRMTRAALPAMRRQGAGRIVNISSILGVIPAPYNAIYAASKHAIEGYSESLDHELRGFGIRVVLIEPAYTSTGFDAHGMTPDQPLAIYDEVRAQAERLMQRGVTAGDPPDIVAQTVLKAARAATPKLRYTAGKMAGRVRLLRRFVPESAFDKSLRKQAGPPA